jgi:hypothetical protein
MKSKDYFKLLITRTLLLSILSLTPIKVLAQTDTTTDSETIWIVGICLLIAIIAIAVFVIKKRRTKN